MTPTRTGAHTATLREQYSSCFTDGLTATTQAATAGDFQQATTLTGRFTAAARQLHHSVVRDALAAGLDWWQIGELFTLHPQAAFDADANLTDATHTPEQRPHLAVICTAGPVAEHDMDTEHGTDLDAQHSLVSEPTVEQLRTAAQLLGDDIWIAVKLPGEYDGDDDLDDDAAVRRWTTVALYPDELGWLREALTLNAEEPDEDEDLEPLL